jgi:hypothetical protein
MVLAPEDISLRAQLGLLAAVAEPLAKAVPRLAHAVSSTCPFDVTLLGER